MSAPIRSLSPTTAYLAGLAESVFKNALAAANDHLRADGKIRFEGPVISVSDTESGWVLRIDVHRHGVALHYWVYESTRSIEERTLFTQTRASIWDIRDSIVVSAEIKEAILDLQERHRLFNTSGEGDSWIE